MPAGREDVSASRVEVGVVSKAHGVRGEMVVVLHDPESTSLDDVDTVYVGGVARAVVQARNNGGAYLLAVEGITDRDVAAGLRGAVVEIERDDLELDDDEVLLSDLVGCRCVLEDGAPWGEIVSVEMGAMQDRLIVRDGNVERQLPVVDAFIANIDLEARVVTVTPPEGLPEDPVP
ncbi:MAG TPA: ribosome maturation factor RimM [Kofleriaceae bacterium]|nr:ribosome maturation factor RimM [Kofleriaceae bacterium]